MNLPYIIQQLQVELHYAKTRLEEKEKQLEQWAKTHLSLDALKADIKAAEQFVKDKAAELKKFVDAQKSVETGKKVGSPEPKSAPPADPPKDPPPPK